jgi:hypothetical protein
VWPLLLVGLVEFTMFAVYARMRGSGDQGAGTDALN